MIQVRGSDFVVDKKNCGTVIFDMAVSGDFSVVDEEKENILNY